MTERGNYAATYPVSFWEPIMTRRFSLDVYPDGDVYCSARKDRYCRADRSGVLPDEPFAWRHANDGYRLYPDPPIVVDADPRWPSVCDHCGKPFVGRVHKRVHQSQLYRNSHTGIVAVRESFPIGAMYYLDADHPGHAGVFAGGGPDGKILAVVCPNGAPWCIDARASNCTLPNDNDHRCWIRHGDPRTLNVHVDKAGRSCAAGAGSIQSGDYHGFLDYGAMRANRIVKPQGWPS